MPWEAVRSGGRARGGGSREVLECGLSTRSQGEGGMASPCWGPHSDHPCLGEAPVPTPDQAPATASPSTPLSVTPYQATSGVDWTQPLLVTSLAPPCSKPQALPEAAVPASGCSARFWPPRALSIQQSGVSVKDENLSRHPWPRSLSLNLQKIPVAFRTKRASLRDQAPYQPLGLTVHCPPAHNTHPCWPFCSSNTQGHSHHRACAFAAPPTWSALPRITGCLPSSGSQPEPCLQTAFPAPAPLSTCLVCFLHRHTHHLKHALSPCPSPNYKLQKSGSLSVLSLPHPSVWHTAGTLRALVG